MVNNNRKEGKGTSTSWVVTETVRVLTEHTPASDEETQYTSPRPSYVCHVG